MSNKSAAEPTEEQVRAAAEVIAGSPTIDAPKLPWPAWCGLARAILRAARIETRSMGDSPVGDESHRRSAEEAKGCHEAPDAPCESPAQSAPVHDALAGQTNNGRPKQPRSISEGREVEAWKYYLDGCWHVCLDEDSDEHIRENGIALSTHEYRWEWK